MEANKETRDKAEQAKAYIEQKYTKMKEEETVKKEAWEKLLRQMDKMNLTPTEKDLIKQEIQHKDAELSRLARTKLTPRDFIPRTIIGRGAFGEVRVCRTKKDNQVVAIKKMKQTEMVKKNQVAHVKAERDIMAEAKNQWIVDLNCSFRDERFLYLVMEFLPGGDLMTLLMRKDILSEEESRFYISETIMAVKSVHDLNYIHRDLKPDNLLIGSDGHVKLSDFGLCKHVEIQPRSTPKQTDGTRRDLDDAARNANGNVANNINKALYNKRSEYKRRQLAFSTVGTPDYIAPEVFGQSGYNETVDWWSVGAILFEMLVGYPPFFSDDPSVTCQKILHWRKTLQIPPEANLSPSATDILKRLMCDADHRLGSNGVDEIFNHPFFEGVDWKKLRNTKSPWIPDLKSDEDCVNFDHFDDEEPFHPPEDRKSRKGRKDIQFIGYTFKKDVEEQKANFVKALNESLQPDPNASDSQFDQSPHALKNPRMP
jgi:serine/threonine kinase 38